MERGLEIDRDRASERKEIDNQIEGEEEKKYFKLYQSKLKYHSGNGQKNPLFN